MKIVVLVMCILQKDVEKTNSSGHLDEKEIVRLVRRDERRALRRMKYCAGVNKNRQCECVIGSNH